MGQNEMIFYIVAAGCMICLMIGIVRKPAYLLVLLLRGAFCAMIVYGISIVCMRKGITAQSILISCPLEQVHCWGFQELLRCMRQRCFYCSNNVM